MSRLEEVARDGIFEAGWVAGPNRDEGGALGLWRVKERRAVSKGGDRGEHL